MHSLILQNLKHDSQANLLNSRTVTADTIEGLALVALHFIILKGYSFCGLMRLALPVGVFVANFTGRLKKDINLFSVA
jgi:hypothetical protein